VWQGCRPLDFNKDFAGLRTIEIKLDDFKRASLLRMRQRRVSSSVPLLKILAFAIS